MATDDPLLELIIDASEVDRERIAGALRGVIAIDKSGTVVPARDFQALAGPQKVLAFLLGRKVAVLLGLATEEPVGPTALATQTGVPPGTMYPTVRRMLADRAISQDADSNYYLAPHQVGAAIESLAKPDASDASAEATPPKRPAKRKAAKATTRKSSAKPAKGRASTKGSADAERGAAPPKTRQSGDFSPAAAVRDLVGQGFFDTPKVLGEVRKRMKDKLSRDVPITTLSPIFTRLLRAGVLDRDTNDDGAYEYVRSAS